MSEADNRRLLEKILCVLKLAHSKEIVKSKEIILKNDTKHKIYSLCDGKHTVTDIAKELRTTQPNVSYHLSSMLETGLILYEDVGGKRYYFKTLE